jgi:hypothetical protein
MSVREIVETEREKQRRAALLKEEEELKKKKKRDSKEFSDNITKIINSFECKFFNIDSSEEDVAKAILDSNDRYLFGEKEYFSGLKFLQIESAGRYIGENKRFLKWKKSLEDKFDIKIYIRRYYTETRRFGNSGFEAPPARHYQGIKASVSIK